MTSIGSSTGEIISLLVRFFPPGEFIFPPGEIILLLVRLFSSWWDFSLQVSSCWSFLLTGKTQDLIDDSINFRDDDWSCFPIRVNQNHHYCQNCFLNLDLIRDDDGTCFPIRVDQHPHFGRRLVATRDIKRGEVRIGWILNHHNHSFSTLSSFFIIITNWDIKIQERRGGVKWFVITIIMNIIIYIIIDRGRVIV